MPWMPEVKQQLVDAAARRHGRRRRRLPVVGIACGAVVLAGAAAVGGDLLGNTQTGPTERGSYTVNVHEDSSGGLCVTADLVERGAPAATVPSRCTPGSPTGVLAPLVIAVVPGGRLVFGLAHEDVARLTVAGAAQVSLHDVKGADRRSFAVVVPGTAPINIDAYTSDGQHLAQLASDQLGPIARGGSSANVEPAGR
jgi:hypothetical protein